MHAAFHPPEEETTGAGHLPTHQPRPRIDYGLPLCGEAWYGNVDVNGRSFAFTPSPTGPPLLQTTASTVSVTSSASARPFGKCESAFVWPMLMLMRRRSAAVVPFGESSPTMSARPPAGVAGHGSPSTPLSSPLSS